MRNFLIILLCISLAGCRKDYQAPVPDGSGWAEFEDATALNLPAQTKTALEGVYAVDEGGSVFGEFVALKWSYIKNGTDTTFHLSGFFGKDISYFICEGKRLNGNILLNGYWRKMVSTETGKMRLTITAANGGSLLLGPNPVITRGSVAIEGLYGSGSETPENAIQFSYLRRLYNGVPNFRILAHRGGGRNSDLLPASENSVEMILKTQQYGSTGIEIDVRFTSDAVPILYHDNTLNLRVIQKSGLVGPIEKYSFGQLSSFVRLKNGEKIPTLRQALDAVVYQTELSFVWLDTKFDGSIYTVRAIQKEYLAKAAAARRNVKIVIGIPGEEQLNQFLALRDYRNTPSLCELTIDDVEKCNADVWAPRFTEGTQNDNVAKIHAQGRLAFVWTLDVPEFITKFVNNGDFDGILSNYPSCVAYNYYIRQ